MRTSLGQFVARFVIGIVVLALVAVAAVLGVTRLGFPNPFEPKTTDRSQPALLKSIQDLSRYDAAVGNFEVIVDVEDDVPYVPDFLAGERSLFVAAGTVDAYVDLGGLAKGDLTLSKDGRTATIRLPEAELDRPNLQQDRTYLFSQERGVINRIGDAISTKDQQRLYLLADKKIAAAAEDTELTARAEKNTRDMLTGLLGALDIEVRFTDAPAAERTD